VSYNGDVEELIQLLLGHNSDVNAKDGYNRTLLLHTASFTRHIEATKLLLKDRPDVNVLAIIADITTLPDCY
jgi:ankyrin repeat protein